MKITLLLTFLLFFGKLFSQNFPAEDVFLLLGKELKVKDLDESDQRNGYHGFYSDSTMKMKYACCDGNHSKYNSLVGKSFTVLDTAVITEKRVSKKYRLKLMNPEIGILYFEYDTQFESNFPFEVVGGLTYPKGYFCKFLTETKYDSIKEIKFSTPELDGICFYKLIRNGKVRTFASCKVLSSGLDSNKMGASIVFENGKTINKPDVKLKSGIDEYDLFIHSVIIELSKAEIEQFKNELIHEVNLNNDISDVPNAELLRKYFNCLTLK